MIKIVALGNSLTAGFGLPPGTSFVDKLQQKLDQLGKEVKIINHGISGDTTQGGVYRIEYALEEGPDIMIIELGANDSLLGIPVEEVEKNLETLIKKCLDKSIQVILVGVTGFYNSSDPYEQKFKDMYKTLAKRYNLRLLPNFLEGVLNKKEFTLFDGIHPNPAGVEIMVKNILPLVLEEIELAEKNKDK